MLMSKMPLLLAADQLQKQPLQEAIIGFLPILIFLAVVFFLLRWYLKSYLKSGLAKSTLHERERHIEHMQRMEELTERIAKALERNDPKV
jgi:hypothetical protein